MPERAPAPPEKESFLHQYAVTRAFQFGSPNRVVPAPDGKSVLFLRSGPRSPVHTLFETDLATGQTRELLTPEALLHGAEEQLSVAERARRERMRITTRGFTGFQLSRDGKKLSVSLGGKIYVVDRATAKVTALAAGEGIIDPQIAPDASAVAYVRGNDVWAVDLATNKERRITQGGAEHVPHGLAEFVAQEEMHRFSGFWWSPDAKSIAYQETDDRPVEVFTILDPMHPERSGNQFPYPRAGKANAAVRLFVTASSGKGKPVQVKWDAERYPYLATVRWSQGAPLTLLVQNRMQTEEVLLRADPKTGATAPLLTEKDAAWLNLHQEFPRWLEDGSGFFWLTERNGGPEIELRSPSGELRGSWVRPEHGYDSWGGYDDATRTLYFSGGPNPTQSYVYRVKDGGAPEQLAVGLPAPSMNGGAISKNGEVLVVTSHGLSSPPLSAAYRAADLAKLAELPSVAERPPFATTTEVRKVGGEPGFWADITRPHDFVKGKKLPVIVYVYGGPTVRVVTHRVDSMEQWDADQGFIVVSFDGRGTPGRGSAWERAVLKDFSEVPLADQVAALKALGAEVPEMDLSRVGIFGWSFGGYMSGLALLKRPDVFKAAVAGAPVTEWRDYDTYYTERYLKLPDENKDGYDKSSLLTWAPKLERPLFLIHGTTDDNVYFFHTLKLSDALLRAGKPHRVLPLSGFTHMVPDPVVMEELHLQVIGFFRENL